MCQFYQDHVWPLPPASARRTLMWMLASDEFIFDGAWLLNQPMSLPAFEGLWSSSLAPTEADDAEVLAVITQEGRLRDSSREGDPEANRGGMLPMSMCIVKRRVPHRGDPGRYVSKFDTKYPENKVARKLPPYIYPPPPVV